MPVIAVMNHKGGVGKTTTTLNLAAAFQEVGKRVLMIDFDPQANLTVHCGFKSVETLDHTLSDVMGAHMRGPRNAAPDLRQAIRTLPSSLDLLPCNRNLIVVEQDLVTVDRYQYILDEVLVNVREQYDFVIIDCQPGAGLLATNALTAADYVLVPVQAEYLAMQGLAHLLQSVSRVRASTNPRLQVLGVLMTMVDLRVLHSREVLETIRSVFRSQIRVCYSMVKVDVKLRESSKAGQTILEYAPTSKGAEAYRSLAQEILASLPDYEDDPQRGIFSDPDFVITVAEKVAGSSVPVAEAQNATTAAPVAPETAISEPVPANAPAATTVTREDDTAASAPPAMPVAVICPMVGFETKPNQRADAPHADHFCHAMTEPLTLSIKRQGLLCFAMEYKQCPLYIRSSAMAVEAAHIREMEQKSSSLKNFLTGALRPFRR